MEEYSLQSDFGRNKNTCFFMEAILKKSVLLTVIGIMILVAAPAIGAQLDFSNEVGAAISFDGSGNFSFTPNSTVGYSLNITGPSSSSALYYEGNIDGTFAIGSVSSPFPGISTASVSGAGQFIIDDGFDFFTADLVWLNIVQFGTSNSLNVLGQANLSNVQYFGADTDLELLASYPNLATSLTFQFVPGVSLNDLITGFYETSFSGSIASVPEAGALLLFGTGLIGLVGYRRVRRMQ